MSAAAVLAGAKALLLTEGWIRGASWRPGEGYCLSGALWSATGHGQTGCGHDGECETAHAWYQALDAVSRVLTARDQTHHLGPQTARVNVILWNDHLCPDIDTVVELIDETLIRLAEHKPAVMAVPDFPQLVGASA